MSFATSDGNVPFLFHAPTAVRARHGFFGTAGGVSTGLYDSLNCGFGSADNAELVAANRARAAAAIGVTAGQLAAVYQVHGRKAILAEGGAPANRDELVRADALVTATEGVGLSILTADCLPVLFADNQGQVVGAAHAGWRGAADGVVASTITLMHKAGAKEISALIGPTIQQASYQVGSEMREELLDSVDTALVDKAVACFAPDPGDERSHEPYSRNNKYRFDLPALVHAQLVAAGVKEIHDCGLDTYDARRSGSPDSPAYFSHRRATHAGETDSGRQIAIISPGK